MQFLKQVISGVVSPSQKLLFLRKPILMLRNYFRVTYILIVLREPKIFVDLSQTGRTDAVL